MNIALISQPHEFWSHFRSNDCIHWKPEIKRLVTIALTLPVGTADVERSFSILNHFKTSRRSKLTSKHVEDIVRPVNGPDLADFDAVKYATNWITTGHRRTDHNFPNTPVQQKP